MKIEISDKQNVLYVDQEKRAGVKLGVQVLDNENVGAGGKSFKVMEGGEMVFEGNTDPNGMAEITLVFNLREDVRKSVQFVLGEWRKDKVVVLDKGSPLVQEEMVMFEFNRLMDDPEQKAVAVFIQKHGEKYPQLVETLREVLKKDEIGALEVADYIVFNPNAGNKLRIMQSGGGKKKKYALFRRNMRLSGWYDDLFVDKIAGIYVAVRYEGKRQEMSCALLGKNSQVISEWYENIFPLGTCRYIVEENGKYCIIDDKGKEISKWYDRKILPIRDGEFQGYREGYYYSINNEGEEFTNEGVNNTAGDNQISTHGKNYVAYCDGEYCLFDKNDNKITWQYDRYEYINNNVCKVTKRGKVCLIDLSNLQEVTQWYDSINKFDDGMYVVRKGKWVCLLNSEFKEVTGWYDSIEKVDYLDACKVRRDGKQSMISAKSGKEITSWMDKITHVGGAIFIFQESGKFKVMDFERILQSGWFDEIKPLKDKFFRVRKGNKWCTIDCGGMEVSEWSDEEEDLLPPVELI